MDATEYGPIIIKRLHSDRDAVIAITGEEGEGKSVLAVEIAMSIDKNFNMEQNCIFSPTVNEMKDKVVNLPRYSVIIADEAVKILYKLNWASRLSIFINQLYALCRKENKATILCMPRFTDFTEFFRNHRIKVWIHVLERGRAVMFSKAWSPFTKDPWYIDENQKQIDNEVKIKKFMDFDTDTKFNTLRKCRNYVTEINWNDLTPEIKEQYVRLRDKHKYDDMDVSQFDKVNKQHREAIEQNARLTVAIKNLTGKSYDELSDEFKIPRATLHRRVSKFSSTTTTTINKQAERENSDKNELKTAEV
jgi:hypothetical protein